MKFILLLIVLGASQLTCTLYNSELACIQDTNLSCRWNHLTSQCLSTDGSNLGCSNSLSFKACLSQTYYPDQTLAQCIFSGYCRKVVTQITQCANNLSRAACLAVEQEYCFWDSGCVKKTYEEAYSIAQSDLIDNASVGICRLISTKAAIHQQGAHSSLEILYRASLLSGDSTKYLNYMLIPGCLEPDSSMIIYLTCNSAGLNSLACMKVPSQSCIFDTQCKQVTDPQKLHCSDYLNKLACLSVTNYTELCTWLNDKCQYTQSDSLCALTIHVSPSVCANVLSVECFYDESNNKCNPMCKSQSNMRTETQCKQSSYECYWTDDMCKFSSDSQCEKLGQNQVSCMNALENCQFIEGQCNNIKSLNTLTCTNGLNKQSCLQLNNPSQVCQFTNGKCTKLQITPESVCINLQNVNPNACRKVTTTACYWVNGNCKITDGALDCSATGLNRLGCLNSSMSPCKWDEPSGSCISKTITRNDDCNLLKLVNAVACRMVQYRVNGIPQLCRYNDSYNCESFTMDNIVKCEDDGLNQTACGKVLIANQSCRWLSNQCVLIDSLGGAVTCSALQSVTSRTCAKVQDVVQKCMYDTNRNSCTTSVPPNTACTASGLNPYACASLSSNCYFSNDSCQVATDFSLLNCDTNYPSKGTCTSITKQGQYCLWNSIDTICVKQSFPVSQGCSTYTNVNKLFCLAYYVSMSKWIYTQHFCTYDSTNKKCIQFTSASTWVDWADCGTTQDVNLHACVAYTKTTKQCYFDSDTLKCTELTDNNKLSQLYCMQCGKTLCSAVTKSGQYCKWVEEPNDIKCAPTDAGGGCSQYTNTLVNANLCATTGNQDACKFDSGNKKCITVDPSVNNLGCDTAGLNLKACISNTNEACYFDNPNYKCTKVTGDVAQKVKCMDSSNQMGCLASLGQACKWDSGTCKDVTKNFASVTCASLNDALYNAIVCASVTTSGEMCAYNSATSHCYSVTMVTDCQSGYNETTCESNQNCDNFDTKKLLCQNKPVQGSNDCQGKTEVDCFNVKTAACAWFNNSCNGISVTNTSTCNQFSSGAKFNETTCSQIKSGYCGYDSTNKVCISITNNNNTCTTPGLNQLACLQTTKGSKCMFDKSCSTIAYAQSCEGNLNEDACLSVTRATCQYNQITKVCSEISDADIMNSTCTTYSDASKITVSITVCKYVGSTQSCLYDTVNHVCKIQTTPLPLCTTNGTINKGYCINYIQNETCTFIDDTCTAVTDFNYKCTAALSFKQCINSRKEACKWNGTSCVTATLNIACTSLTNVNAIACMQNVNGNEQCQFQDNGFSSTCIIPISITQCDGLNKVACLSSTTHPCYYSTICVDISLSPFQAQCNSSYSFTSSGCSQIQTPGQLCKWDGSNCTVITTSASDLCSAYNSNTYSPQVCASIQTSACFWNNGCVAGVAANCNSKGANKLACIGATSGNCIFTNLLCLDVTIDDVITSQCTDPSNQNGCLQLNNGQACKWTTQCTSITVNQSCTSYSSVNAGVCAQTTDTPCTWNANSCIAVTASTTTCQKGMNLLACVQYTTTASCYFASNMCQTVGNIDNLNCTSNLNQSACLSHTTQCCKWTGTACIAASSGNICANLTNYSKFCCINLIGDHCSYSSTCSQLTVQNSRCQEAINITACLWIVQSCKWVTSMMACVPVPPNNGCESSINGAACVGQTDDFCMYDATNLICLSGSISKCSGLQYSSKSDTQCLLATDVGCMQNTDRTGCSTTGISSSCQNRVNKIGCLDNTTACSWENDSCKNPPNGTPLDCPGSKAGPVSRGYCLTIPTNCKLDSNYFCIQATPFDGCADYNSPNKSDYCTIVTDAPCQYNSTSKRCTTNIIGSVCSSSVNKLGCKYIQNNCYWEDNCKTNPEPDSDTCESIFNQYTCLRNISTSCVWDSVNHACITYTGAETTCVQHTDSVTSPGVCYYYSTDYCSYVGTGCQLEVAQSQCTNSKSPLGCQANSKGTCYWDISEGKCYELTGSGADKTCYLLRYSNKAFCLAPIGEGQTCHWTNNLCLSADVSNVTCLSDLALNGCRAVAKTGEQCIFKSACQYTDNKTTSCTNNLNIYGCVAVLADDQYCKWLGQQCSTLTEDGFVMDTHIIINQNVCRRAYTKGGAVVSTLPPIPVKYDSDNFVCTISDRNDKCDTPGLNYYGCLMTMADTCDWNGTKCISYLGTTYTTCEGYATVSSRVCAMIQGVKCYQDPTTLSCKTFVETDTVFVNQVSTLQGLNRLACLSITKWPTIWLSNQCIYNYVSPAQTQCGADTDVNPASCAQIDIDDVICKYNSDGLCTTQFDASVDTCDTPGLNLLGCVQVKNAKCQFINGKCTFYNGNTSICSNLINVNALVCGSLTTMACKFSYVSRGCVDVQTSDRCDSEGINTLGCSNLDGCTQISGQCMCTGMTYLYSLIDCTKYQKQYCIQSQCLYDENLNACRNKICNDVSIESCNSTKIGRQTCYVNKTYCASAYTCSDLFNVSNCTSYFLNGVQCNIDKYNLNHCVDQTCDHYSEDKCSGICTWASYECVQKDCRYMKKETCSGIMKNLECFWNGEQCIGLASCQEYASHFDSDTVSTVCAAKKILNKQCKWELTKPLGNTYHCTSSLCAQFGSSMYNCHGKETSEQVCVLLTDYTCIACSEITDSCTCMSMNGYCYYTESGGCRSNPCSAMDEQGCLSSGRCVYNTKCIQACSKLEQTECSTRTTDCHWDSTSYMCVDGVEQSTSINTLADIIEVSNSWAFLINVSIIIAVL